MNKVDNIGRRGTTGSGGVKEVLWKRWRWLGGRAPDGEAEVEGFDGGSALSDKYSSRTSDAGSVSSLEDYCSAA